ncbi:MAG: hypothetical protein QG614_558 [Patescibacteria group bacterium]|nr:hypothetical protein [Patescibacteria group bacterium]
MKIDYSRYLISFIITISIFVTAFYVSNFFNDKKINSINSIGDNIAIDILSNETQFLLKEISCTEDNFNPVAGQIGELGDRLTYAEGELGNDNNRVQYLKKYYSLLQIKDYIVGKKIADKCGKAKKPIFVIYMYPSKLDCPDCGKQAVVLAELRKIYPELRVYTFDSDLDLMPVQTLKTIYDIKATSTFPILVVEDKAYYGYKDLTELKKLLPDTLKIATSTDATSTQASTTKATTSSNISKYLKSNTNSN